MAQTLTVEDGRVHWKGWGGTTLAWDAAFEANGRRFSVSRGELAGEPGEGDAVTLRCDALDLEWTLEPRLTADGGRLILESRIQNRSPKPIALGAFFPAVFPSLPFPTAQGTLLPTPPGCSPRRVYRLQDPDCPTTSRVMVQLSSVDPERAMQIGFVSFHRAHTLVRHDSVAQDGIVALRASFDFGGWELPPNDETGGEAFTVALSGTPHDQLEGWADEAKKRCAPRLWEDAPIGWLGWAWVDPFTVERYEEVVLRNTAAIRERLSGFGVSYVWVSIGNLADGVPGNWLDWNRDRFPSGPEFLARALRQRGFRLGFWCAPFWVCESSVNMERLRDAVLRDAAGKPLVARQEWPFGSAGFKPPGDRPRVFALDPSHPKTRSFLEGVFKTYRDWGVRYFMIDFLAAGAGAVADLPYASHYERRQVPGPEVYTRGLSLVRDAAGDDTYLLSSSGPTQHNAGTCDAIRTGNDFGEGRALYPNSYFYPATFVVNSAAFWTGAATALANQGANYYTHRKLYLNDSGNVLTVDSPIPEKDARIHATIHALSGGPSMLGDDIDRMDERRLELIKKTLPRPKAVARPVDLFRRPYPAMPRLFVRHIRKTWGRFSVVAVYNFGEASDCEEIAPADVGLNPGKSYLVWEFWNGEFIGEVTDRFNPAVPPGSVRVFRMVEDAGRPVLLGSDMHLTMGEMEVDTCSWNEDELVLHGTAIRPPGERGNLYFRLPPTLRVREPAGLWIAKDARDSSLIVKAALTFGETGTAAFRIACSPTEGPLDMAALDLR